MPLFFVIFGQSLSVLIRIKDRKTKLQTIFDILEPHAFLQYLSKREINQKKWRVRNTFSVTSSLTEGKRAKFVENWHNLEKRCYTRQYRIVCNSLYILALSIGLHCIMKHARKCLKPVLIVSNRPLVRRFCQGCCFIAKQQFDVWQKLPTIDQGKYGKAIIWFLCQR